MEGISNDKLHTQGWLPALLDKLEPLSPDIVGKSRQPYEPASPHPSSMTLRQMASLAEELREPLPNKSSLERKYNHLLADRFQIIQRVEEIIYQPITQSDLYTDRASLRLMTLFGGLLGMAMAINGLLQQFAPNDESLQHTADILIQDSLSVGERAIDLRPLGATHAVPAVSVAWALTRDEGQRMYAEYVLKRLNASDLEEDMYNEVGMIHTREARWWQWKFHRTRVEIDQAYGRPREYPDEKLDWHDSECQFQ